MANSPEGDGSHPAGSHNHMNSSQNILPGQRERPHYGNMRHSMYNNTTEQGRMMSPTHMQQQQIPMAHAGIPDRVGPVTRSGMRWHESADPNLRKMMIQQIIRLLRAKKPQARQEWINRLPDMAKKLEDKLFYQSTSEQDYSDRETLTRRLQNIALQITRDRKRLQQQQQQRVVPTQGRYPDRRASSSGMRSHTGTPTMYPPNQAPSNQRMHMPIDRMPRQQQHSGAPSPMPPMTQEGTSSERNKTMVLKQQQHRLLLLRHASRCTYPPGTCPATKHCEAYKRLWVHIANCRNPQCETPHCVSSRYVLAHYHRCQEVNCPVCRPVREAIAKQNQMKMQQQQQGRNSRNPRMPTQRQAMRSSTNPPIPSPSPHSFNRQRANSPFAFQHNVPQNHLPIRAPSSQSIMPTETERMNFSAAETGRSQSRMTHSGTAPVMSPRTDIEVRMAELERRRKEIAEKKRKEAAEEEAIQIEYQRLQSLKNSGMSTQPAVARNTTMPAAGTTRSYSRNATTEFRAPPVENTSGAVHVAKRRAVHGHSSQSRPLHQPVKVQQQRYASSAVRKERLVQSLKSMQNQTSLVYTFGAKEIEEHVKSLSYKCASSSGIYLKPTELKLKAISLLKMLMDEEFSWIFNKPVDPVELGLPDYFDVIKNPMDLGTIKKNVESNYYKSLKEFANDVRLVFNNAMIYNPESGDVHSIARQYGFKFEKNYNTMIREMKKAARMKRKNDHACVLCGGEKYTFEPPVYYCSGKCNQKIRRGAFFYFTPDNKQFYCLTCYNSCLKDLVLLEDGSQISKLKLKKKKNDEVQEESWVECNMCKRWYHQICVLFNSRRNDQSKNEPFYCPCCVLRYIEQLRAKRLPQKLGFKFSAKDLARSGYSDFLEMRVKRRILEARKDFAKSRNCPIGSVPECNDIIIRVVSCRDVDLLPRAGLERLYGQSHNYPKSLKHRVKCILLFKRVDGVDVLILGLYTQVYGSHCPAPNTRTLYIAYLDSVNYFTPSFCRTPVYKEVLSSTLEFEKKRGITKTFIWVCPPLAGDDYILYCHPKDQKTPKADMLRNWYFSLLEDCRKRGVIVSIDNLYDAYFQRMACVTSVPNFDGDYWPGVTEQFIEQLENEKVDPKSIAPRKKRTFSRNKHLEKNGKKRSKSKGKKQNKSKKKNKSKTKSKAKLQPSLFPDITIKKEEQTDGVNDVDDDKTQEAKDLTPQSFIPPRPLNCIEFPQQDALTVKIGDVIQQMKEDFMVVYMHHICSSCSCDIDKPNQTYWLPELYDPAAIDLDYTKNKYAPPFALCDGCYRKQWAVEFPGTEPVYDGLTLEKVSIMEHELENIKGFGTSNDEGESDQMIKDTVKELLVGICERVETEISASNLDDDDIFPENTTRVKEEFPNRSSVTPAVSTPRRSKPPATENVFGNIQAAPSPIVPPLNLETETAPSSAPLVSPKSSSNAQSSVEEIITILPEGQDAPRRSAWIDAPCSLLQMKPFKTQVPESTVDTDAVMESQFFDTRQQFLSLCQGNKYQFDQLRRAKHSSMMVLYHLHNPHLPSFVHSCNNCKKNIVSGDRYSCRVCDDYDLCELCAQNSNHVHELHCANDVSNTRVIPAHTQMYLPNSHERKAAGMQRRYPQEYYRGQGGVSGYPAAPRPKVQAHMALLVHASNCKDPNCSNKHCARMKQLLKHGANCKTRVKGQCKICKRIWGLLHLHSRHCTAKGSCNVPGCNKLRAHLRRQRIQRQDRRIMMHTQRMQQERLQAQQVPAQASPRGSETPGFTASSPSMEVQRGAKQGKHIR